MIFTLPFLVRRRSTDRPARRSWICLRKRGIRPALVVDEGGAVVESVFPGVDRDCALIGIAEKGLTNIEFRAKSGGGHASMPPVHTIVGELAQAVVDVENHPFPRQLTKPVREMLNILGRHSGFAYRILFANMWCLQPLFDKVCRMSGGELNAMMRTTCAITKMQGGEAFNVIPPGSIRWHEPASDGEGYCGFCQSIPGEDDTIIRILKCLYSREEILPQSRIRTAKSIRGSAQAVKDTWTDAIISPYLMMACSDSWHYCRITDHVYKFSAMKLSKEERGMIHGNNERVPIDTLVKTVEFYVRLMKMC